MSSTLEILFDILKLDLEEISRETKSKPCQNPDNLRKATFDDKTIKLKDLPNYLDIVKTKEDLYKIKQKLVSLQLKHIINFYNFDLDLSFLNVSKTTFKNDSLKECNEQLKSLLK